MNVEELVEKAKDAITVKRVFGDPYEKDGVTIIPAAKVGGGAGGGSGEGPDGQGKGGGGGFGVGAKPAGAYIIKDGNVKWEPALDINRVILGGQILGAIAFLTLRSVMKSRNKRKSKERAAD